MRSPRLFAQRATTTDREVSSFLLAAVGKYRGPARSASPLNHSSDVQVRNYVASSNLVRLAPRRGMSGTRAGLRPAAASARQRFQPLAEAIARDPHGFERVGAPWSG